MNNRSRATLAEDWTNDNLFSYYNHVGNCYDYANIMTIMCRHLGIPCTTVENSYHTANAVWMDGEWVCIDVSVLDAIPSVPAGVADIGRFVRLVAGNGLISVAELPAVNPFFTPFAPIVAFFL